MTTVDTETGEIVSGLELSEDEQARYALSEQIIERGLETFFEVGAALTDIRDSRLYRADYATFEAYCLGRWGLRERRAYQLMDAAEVVTRLKVEQIVQLPTNEGQARALGQFPPDLQPAIMQTAAARYTRPTASEIERVGRILTEVASTGHVDTGNGTSTPLDAALTLEDEEAIKRSKTYIHENGRQKPKTNYEAPDDQPDPRDLCQTPNYALDPLLPFLPEFWTIWEPASGEGLLVEALYDSGYSEVVQGDVQTGENFFEYTPDQWDCLITNPPFSGKYRWLERCYALGKPFALLLPLETLGAKTAQTLFQEYGLELILMNQRIDFKMPNKGFEGSAQFPAAWFTWGLAIGHELTFTDITDAKRRFVAELGGGE